MSNLSSLETPITPPPRSGGRHQIKRSLTEFTSPVLHLHQRNHRKVRHHDDKSARMSSSSLHIRHSLDIPRSEAVSPIMSPNQSRRASLLVQKEADEKLDLRDNKESKRLEDQEKASLRAGALKSSLVELNEFSTNATRRLDEVYYAVLEKTSALQNTVVALTDLAEASRDIQVGFEKVSRELETDILKQLRAVGRFDAQQRTIESLQSRIHKGRDKIDALTGRVDVVRERIETWERADKAWQERTRKRLKITWTVMSVIFLLIVTLFLTITFTPDSLAHPGAVAMNTARNTTADGESTNRSKFTHQLAKDDSGSDTKLVWKTAMDDGERLRVFDEL